jgi:hypothetical protein
MTDRRSALTLLNENIVVRFVTNRDGLMVRIEVLGPIENIMALEES